MNIEFMSRIKLVYQKIEIHEKVKTDSTNWSVNGIKITW